MCKKLIVVLLVAALSIPVSAAYIGFDNDGNEGVNPLFIDLDGGGTVTPHPQAQSWLFQSSWTGPTSQNFVNPEATSPGQIPVAQLNCYEKVKEINQGGNGATSVGLSRNRCSGMVGVAGTGDFSLGTRGYGMNYLELTVTGLQPDTEYKFYMWAYEANGVWANPTNNYQKFVAYSQQNPKTWLDAHVGQYAGVDNEPNGYGAPTVNPLPNADTNMPGSANNPYTGAGLSLYDMMLARASCSSVDAQGVADAGDHLGDFARNCAIFKATTNDDGAIVIYEWNDNADWGGSAHIPINGILIIPEPATIALLGLGGLALIRRKRA
jgi:hypothetical protein